MSKHVFECIDGHTCGNPVRLVRSGGPILEGVNMSEKRQHFIREYDWIRRGLMFEPRGHDMMSGSILYPPHDQANDVAVLFIETSGCLPMCGHGTIGTITIGIEAGLIKPQIPGIVRMEAPAGLIEIEYKSSHRTDGSLRVDAVKLLNVPAFLHTEALTVECPVLGEIQVDVSFGGNFYAIVDEQANFKGIDAYSVGELIGWSRILREKINALKTFIHPADPTIQGCSHILWSGSVIDRSSTARNAVFYGDKAIDRSPCGTGTSARMAQWYKKEKLRSGDAFIHESVIGSKFIGAIESELDYYGFKAIRPSIEGWAKVYGENCITIDPVDDPYAYGFQVI
jgi:4-hydroxyproline epimerase